MAAAAADGDLRRKSLIVEGWRLLPHSYAIVNQWQLLALLRRDIALKVVDVPFYRRTWQTHSGLFEPHAEQALASIETAQPNESADVTLRIFAPFSFAPSRSRLTAVFGTLEQQAMQRHQFADAREYEQLRQGPPPEDVKVVTPSLWSAEGFYQAGFAQEQVLIVPHGVDIATFHPMPEARKHARENLQVRDGEFVFLSVGGMSGNKGIDLLLRGFAEICRNYPNAKLVLKGIDPLYRSKDMVLATLQTLSASDRERIADKITYIGDALSHQGMAELYQVADAYVSPYRAEGFNMPVLEAAACGVPVLCTSGGSTDDFVTDEFAARIASKKSITPIDGQNASRLNPSLEHLIALMKFVIEDDHWRQQAAETGPRHVGIHYTWDQVIDMLIRRLLNQGGRAITNRPLP